MSCATRIALVGLVLAARAAFALADEAEDAFNSLYGNDYKKVTATPDKADDVALAADLLKAAKAQGVQPGLVAILCDKAHELGVRLPAGYETAVEAMEVAAQAAPAGAAAALDRVATIREKQYQAVKGPDKADAGEVFIESVLAAAGAHMASGAAAEASALLRKALVVANAIKSDRKNEIQGRIDSAAARLRVEKQVADLTAKLVANPQDAAVRKQLVQACLVELDDPAQAEKFLDESSDPLLRKYVPAVSKGVDAAPEIACMELGEWYRGLGEAAGVTPGGKEAMLRRARAYYQRFLDLHKTEDLARTQAALAVKKADEALAKLGPPAAPADAGGWVDCLKLVEIKRDVVQGKWERKGRALALSAGEASRVTVPVAPTGSYEVEVTFVRKAGETPGMILPVGTTACDLVLSAANGVAHGLENIHGKWAGENETAVRPGTLVNGREYTVSARVLVDGQQADIAVALDGKPLLRWKGPLAALSIHDFWRLPDPRCLGLGAHRAAVEFRRMRARAISGELKTPDAAAKPEPRRPKG